jgi:hypothetical protein
VGAATAAGEEPAMRNRCSAGGGSIRRQIATQVAVRVQRSGENTSRMAEIDKSLLAFPEPRRIRDRNHMRHVIKQPCLACGRRPSDPHHLRFAQSRALARKVSDDSRSRSVARTIARFIAAGMSGIDPLAAARALWLETHPLPRMEASVRYDATTGEIAESPVVDEQGICGFSPNR